MRIKNKQEKDLKKLEMKKIKEEIAQLEASLTGDFMQDMDTKDAIHKLKMQLNNVAPTCSLGEECENCGS